MHNQKNNQKDPLQRKEKGEENENMQSMAPPAMQLMASPVTPPDDNPIQKKENNTGLPDDLKSGVENLSGQSMDDVKVHYNSNKPAEVGAHAYAQGSEIHVGAGQEKHLPHEAWHVVQQKENRVTANTNVNGAAVNDNPGLESEADVMGAKALSAAGDTKQLKKDDAEGGTKQLATANVIQREPIQSQAGTAAEFLDVFNNTPSAMGTLTGDAAHEAMLRLANTEMEFPNPVPRPSTTPYFNQRPARYIYTTNGGWIDMVHFLFYAGKAYRYKQQAANAAQALQEIEAMPWYQSMWIDQQARQSLRNVANQSPVGEAVQDGHLQERSDQMFAAHSAYSYEDLPSDTFGARFAVQHFNPALDATFGEQLFAYLVNVLGAVEPTAAPNYNSMPADEAALGETPTRTNTSSTPVYTAANP